MLRREAWVLATILLIAAGLRVAGASGGLWLDEVWSLNLAGQLDTAVLGLAVDNNHPVNTLAMRLIGPDAADGVYRIPAAACSVVSVWLAWIWGGRRSPAAAILAAGAMALGMPMVVYGSEARGYAYAGFCLLVCIVCLDRPRISPATAAGYIAAATVGVLAHPTFLPALAAVIGWHLFRSKPSKTWALHLPTVIIGASIWWIFVRRLEVGGGGELNPVEAIVQTLRLSLAYPFGGDAASIVAIVALILAALALGLLMRRGDDRWVLYLLGIFLFPTAAAVVQAMRVESPLLLAPRYFFLPMMLQLLLLADASADLLQSAPRRRIATMTAVLGFAAANLWADVQFLRFGRGDFGEVARIIAGEGKSPITISADNEFRARTMLAHAQRRGRLPAGARFISELNPADLPEWMLVHIRHDDFTPDARFGGPAARYELLRVVRHYGPSGLGWAVYRRVQ